MKSHRIAGLVGARSLGRAALLVALVSGGFSACKSGAISRVLKPDGGRYYAVTAETTPFFRYGPQQGNGPDKSLPKDTLMTLIRSSFGYSKVQLTPEGQQGYVASEDIQPAPPTLIAALTATPPPVSGHGSTLESFDLNSTDVPPPETLPDPDLPPTAPDPTPQ